MGTVRLVLNGVEISNADSSAIYIKNAAKTVISSPELQKSSSYILYSSGTSTATSKDGLYEGGSYQGGTKVVEFTMADAITFLTNTGVTTQGSAGPGGGNPGFGGNQDQDRPRRNNNNN